MSTEHIVKVQRLIGSWQIPVGIDTRRVELYNWIHAIVWAPLICSRRNTEVNWWLRKNLMHLIHLVVLNTWLVCWLHVILSIELFWMPKLLILHGTHIWTLTSDVTHDASKQSSKTRPWLLTSSHPHWVSKSVGETTAAAIAPRISSTR